MVTVLGHVHRLRDAERSARSVLVALASGRRAVLADASAERRQRQQGAAPLGRRVGMADVRPVEMARPGEALFLGPCSVRAGPLVCAVAPEPQVKPLRAEFEMAVVLASRRAELLALRSQALGPRALLPRYGARRLQEPQFSP